MAKATHSLNASAIVIKHFRHSYRNTYKLLCFIVNKRSSKKEDGREKWKKKKKMLCFVNGRRFSNARTSTELRSDVRIAAKPLVRNARVEEKKLACVWAGAFRWIHDEADTISALANSSVNQREKTKGFLMPLYTHTRVHQNLVECVFFLQSLSFINAYS